MPADITQPYVYISLQYTWREAQIHCRELHTDLAIVRNQEENRLIQQLIPAGTVAYIGLFRDPYAWSDRSNSSFRNWAWNQPDVLGECVALLESRRWKTEVCSNPKPFICYRSEVVTKRQILRLKVKSGLNGNDPDLKTAILAEIQRRLQKLGEMNVTRLEWREAADGRTRAQ
ncbi:struthiocalcin-2-like isoform X2 [Pseudorasbora parva]|uniref:struthiocalcin-2-like isoform X2 n=1 Tax=Pseudorasbora parva TaxID=51549 RepID=UPI00351E6F27